MSVDPAYFGVTGFVFPVGSCDYPAEADVRSGVGYGSGAYTGTFSCVATDPAGPHGPHQIFWRLLLDQGLVTDPASDLAWPCYYSGIPDRDTRDNAVCVFNSQGRDQGREHATGERAEFRGVQILVRSATPAGYAKAREIALALDDLQNVVVRISSYAYLVGAVTRTTDVLDLGKGVPAAKRNLYAVNAVAPIRQLSP